MAVKVKKQLMWPIMIAAAILMVVLYIALRGDASFMTNASQWVNSHFEGFSSVILDTPKCPPGYKFFNDERGESLCCAGAVNPYSHKCLVKDVCALKPNADNLPMCANITRGKILDMSKAQCPPSLPHYALSGKCCRNSPDLDGADCQKSDLADPANFCSDKKCTDMKLLEASNCPASLTKASTNLGDREAAKYGAQANGFYTPACIGGGVWCLPPASMQAATTAGIFKDKDPQTWAYSCSAWERVNVKKDLSVKLDYTYP